MEKGASGEKAMRTNCVNCGEEFEDPRPAAFQILANIGITDSDLLRSSLSWTPLCPHCAEEGTRLQMTAHTMVVALNRQIDLDLKRFGANRRQNRIREQAVNDE